ncbi:MAG: hypothetical protein PHI97_29200 [Desulfobulbus sp.]|nr:hypothetical protein [Desulfobulbus sp.]
MGDALRRLKHRKETLNRLRELDDRRDSVVLIHYSCESFYDRPDGSTPRVTSIAVRNLGTGQTESFSIHKVAELKGIPVTEIAAQYDTLEKEMLDEFGHFLQAHSHCSWVHWNMRDISYGFQAIEHRHKVLGGVPPSRLPEERKFDLARALIAIYGIGYAGHPRLEYIVQLNKITDKSFLSGKDEAAAFEQGEFVKLHQSTLRKVDILANIFGRTLDGSLKTNSTWWKARGLHPQVFAEFMTEHWLGVLIAFLGTIASISGLVLVLK